GEEIVNAMGNRHADRVRAEVVIVDQAGRTIPAGARILEGTDQLALFGVHADDGPPLPLEPIAQIANVEKLLVAIWTGVGGELLAVDAERIAHVLEQPRDGARTHSDPEVAERQGHFGSRAAGPFHAGDGIAAGVVFQQVVGQGDAVGRFYSMRMRPRPAVGMRSGAAPGAGTGWAP